MTIYELLFRIQLTLEIWRNTSQGETPDARLVAAEQALTRIEELMERATHEQRAPRERGIAVVQDTDRLIGAAMEEEGI